MTARARFTIGLLSGLLTVAGFATIARVGSQESPPMAVAFDEVARDAAGDGVTEPAAEASPDEPTTTTTATALSLGSSPTTAVPARTATTRGSTATTSPSLATASPTTAAARPPTAPRPTTPACTWAWQIWVGPEGSDHDMLHVQLNVKEWANTQAGLALKYAAPASGPATADGPVNGNGQTGGVHIPVTRAMQGGSLTVDARQLAPEGTGKLPCYTRTFPIDYESRDHVVSMPTTTTTPA